MLGEVTQLTRSIVSEGLCASILDRPNETDLLPARRSSRLPLGAARSVTTSAFTGGPSHGSSTRVGMLAPTTDAATTSASAGGVANSTTSASAGGVACSSGIAAGGGATSASAVFARRRCSSSL